MKLNQKPLLNDIAYLFVGMLLALIIYQVLGFALETENPLVTVVSCSMHPTLNIGDIMLLKGVDKEGVQEGEIIVYMTPARDKLIIHRVVNIEGDKITTKGDNNLREDSLAVEPEWIKGKSIMRLPLLGYPKIFLVKLIGDNEVRIRC